MTRDCLVHPGAAALGFARVRIEIKAAEQFPARVGDDAKEAHRGIPYFRAVRLDAQAVEFLGDVEHAIEHSLLRKVLLQLLLGEGVALRAQLLRGPGDVPRLQLRNSQFPARKIAQLVIVASRKGQRLVGKIVQEFEYLQRRIGHFRTSDNSA